VTVKIETIQLQKISYNEHNHRFIIRGNSWYNILTLGIMLIKMTQNFRMFSTDGYVEKHCASVGVRVAQNPQKYEEKIKAYCVNG